MTALDKLAAPVAIRCIALLAFFLIVPGKDAAFAAKRTVSQCADRHADCMARCYNRYTDIDAAARCVVRTCTPQYNSCVSEATSHRAPAGTNVSPGGMSVSPSGPARK